SYQRCAARQESREADVARMSRLEGKRGTRRGGTGTGGVRSRPPARSSAQRRRESQREQDKDPAELTNHAYLPTIAPPARSVPADAGRPAARTAPARSRCGPPPSSGSPPR